MKPRLIYFIGLALVCLALAAFALVRAPAVSGSSGASRGGHYVLSGADLLPGPSRQYRTLLKGGDLSGGRYQLAGMTQSRVQDLASGGGYRLTTPAGSENGCCCMFLPCVRK